MEKEKEIMSFGVKVSRISGQIHMFALENQLHVVLLSSLETCFGGKGHLSPSAGAGL